MPPLQQPLNTRYLLYTGTTSKVDRDVHVPSLSYSHPRDRTAAGLITTEFIVFLAIFLFLVAVFLALCFYDRGVWDYLRHKLLDLSGQSERRSSNRTRLGGDIENWLAQVQTQPSNTTSFAIPMETHGQDGVRSEESRQSAGTWARTTMDRFGEQQNGGSEAIEDTILEDGAENQTAAKSSDTNSLVLPADVLPASNQRGILVDGPGDSADNEPQASEHTQKDAGLYTDHPPNGGIKDVFLQSVSGLNSSANANDRRDEAGLGGPSDITPLKQRTDGHVPQRPSSAPADIRDSQGAGNMDFDEIRMKIEIEQIPSSPPILDDTGWFARSVRAAAARSISRERKRATAKREKREAREAEGYVPPWYKRLYEKICRRLRQMTNCEDTRPSEGPESHSSIPSRCRKGKRDADYYRRREERLEEQWWERRRLLASLNRGFGLNFSPL